MNEQLAKTILGITPDESDLTVIREAVDDKVFELATYFLNRPFLPKLAEVRIKRLEELIAAEGVLMGVKSRTTSAQKEAITFSEKGNDLKNLIATYNESESKIKQALTRAISPGDVINAYQNWQNIFKTYADRFVKAYPGYPFAREAQADVKISSQVNMMEMLEELNDDANEKPLLHLEYSRLKKLSN